VSEIQTPNLSLHGWYLYMISTNSNRFRCLKFRHLIYLWLVFMYDFDKLKPISVSEIQLPYLYLYLTMVGIFIYGNLKPVSVM
jgi:hypothetical protein